MADDREKPLTETLPVANVGGLRNLGESFSLTMLEEKPFRVRTDWKYLRLSADPHDQTNTSRIDELLCTAESYSNMEARKLTLLATVDVVCAFPTTDLETAAIIHGYTLGLKQFSFEPDEIVDGLMREIVVSTRVSKDFYASLAEAAFKGGGVFGHLGADNARAAHQQLRELAAAAPQPISRPRLLPLVLREAEPSSLQTS